MREVEVVHLYAAHFRMRGGIRMNREEQVRLLLIGKFGAGVKRYECIVLPRVDHLAAHALLDEFAQPLSHIQNQFLFHQAVAPHGSLVGAAVSRVDDHTIDFQPERASQRALAIARDVRSFGNRPCRKGIDNGGFRIILVFWGSLCRCGIRREDQAELPGAWERPWRPCAKLTSYLSPGSPGDRAVLRAALRLREWEEVRASDWLLLRRRSPGASTLRCSFLGQLGRRFGLACAAGSTQFDDQPARIVQPRYGEIRVGFQIEDHARHSRRCLCHSNSFQQLVTHFVCIQPISINGRPCASHIEEDSIRIFRPVGTVVSFAGDFDGDTGRIGQ